MIFIVSSLAREATLLATLCEQRSWPCESCTSLSDFFRLAEKSNPRAIVVRLQLLDGYSDDILAFLKRTRATPAPWIIVIVPADCSIRQEARQINLGADCVLHDPIRMEVLFEYLGKYRTAGAPASASTFPLTYEFAGVEVFPLEQRLARQGESIHVAPQEIDLLRLLSHSSGKVVSYTVLYSELFQQRFAGDTANCRVLLGKISASFRQLGVDLRTHIKVIPKSGYLYSLVPDSVSPKKRKPNPSLPRD